MEKIVGIAILWLFGCFVVLFTASLMGVMAVYFVRLVL